MSGRNAHPARRLGAGFSLIELLLVMAMMVLLLLGLLELFESNSALAREQTQVAEMQQAQRSSHNVMTRMIRMAGRGGLAAILDDGGTRLLPSIAVRDNVGSDGDTLEVVPGFEDSPLAVQGTDILTIRGVLSSSVYQINTAGGVFTLFDAGGAPTSDPETAVSGTVVVNDPSPTGRPQDLTALSDAIDSGVGEALVLVSPVDETVYAVVELDPASSSATETQVTLGFLVSGGGHTGDYATLYRSGGGGGQLPSTLISAAWVGIVEEYRFYVRDADAEPTLSMARVLPGTNVPHGGLASTMLDIAEGVRELQVALGFDSALGDPLVDRNGDGRVNEDDVLLTESEDGDGDDWLFNGDADDPDSAPWVPPWDDDPGSGAPPRPELYYVRLSTLARVRTPDRNWQAPTIPLLENAVTAELNTREERLHRRKLLTTVIDLRNL